MYVYHSTRHTLLNVQAGPMGLNLTLQWRPRKDRYGFVCYTRRVSAGWRKTIRGWVSCWKLKLTDKGER